MNKHVVMLLGFSVLFISLLFSSSPVFASYNCGNGLSGHCYAENAWSIPLWYNYRYSYFSAFIPKPQVVYSGLNSNNTNAFVTQEIWLYDQGRSCKGEISSWVEAGVLTVGSKSYLFWDDCRPGQNYFQHTGPQLYGADFSYPISLFIYRRSSNSWNIDLYAHNSSMTGISTANTMTPNLLEVGEELSGQKNAHTNGSTIFQDIGYNFSNRSGGPLFVTNTGNGGYSEWPTNSKWITYPNSTNYGGKFSVWITSPN